MSVSIETNLVNVALPVDVNLVGEVLPVEEYEPSKAHRDEAAQIERASGAEGKNVATRDFVFDPNNNPQKPVAKSPATSNTERKKQRIAAEKCH